MLSVHQNRKCYFSRLTLTFYEISVWVLQASEQHMFLLSAYYLLWVSGQGPHGRCRWALRAHGARQVQGPSAPAPGGGQALPSSVLPRVGWGTQHEASAVRGTGDTRAHMGAGATGQDAEKCNERQQ